MTNIFGTDGIRSEINTAPMTAEFVVRIALAAGRWFVDNKCSKTPTTNPMVVIGKDTRLSGYMLESALVAGFTSIGMNCRLLGPVPTAAVSYLTHSMRADLGVMISASHNPYKDNGIKLFGPDGLKLDDKIEGEISNLIKGSIKLSKPKNLGRARRIVNSSSRYTEFTKSTFDQSLNLNGLKIVVDCGNGAAYKTAPEALYELGAEVLPIGVNPDGLNINEGCGATKPDLMAKVVKEKNAHFGISLDGDADRLILSDEFGKIYDGDQVVASLAKDFQKRGLLKTDVVGTQMSNLGLEKFLNKNNIGFVRTFVGDRYILEQLIKQKGVLGGEPSGHILLPKITRSGDGLIAALQILAIVCRENKPPSQILDNFFPIPQKLVNLEGINKNILSAVEVKKEIELIEKEIGSSGRMLLRASGTEPLIRIMVESSNKKIIEKYIYEIKSILLKYNNLN